MKTNRRNFLQTIGVGATGLTLGSSTLSFSSCTSSADNKEKDDGQVLFIGDNIALTDTQYGKVKGYVLRGINYFLGIPYGADTSGANRFMPPQKPKPWTDVFPAVWWGNSAPQMLDGMYSRNRYSTFVDHWNYDDVSEDCLRINVFTPALKDDKKRPVLVWLHGGGFTSGNGIEHDGYNGENIARDGDVVFCSVNHRLGPLGFSYLGGVGGEKYEASGNVGMLDLVAALEWVRDNIENFGGEPGNVTIMGQSGGGSKVTTLTAMPSAHGLFHKAVVLSGSLSLSAKKENAAKLGENILKEAGITGNQIEKLQQIPWKEYYTLASRAAAKLMKDGGIGSWGFAPVIDGKYLPQDPYFPAATPLAANIPMIISSVREELPPNRDDATLENITLDEVKEKVKVRAGFIGGLGDKAGEVVDTYAKVFPDKKPIEIWALISANRKSTVALADSKSQLAAPVYVAWFSWQPPLFDNRMRAFHCVDICFWFKNTDLMLSHTGGGARPRKLSEMMAGSLVQFMKTGDPNGRGLPAWSKYTSEIGEVMCLDDVCEVKKDPDREARKLLPTV